MKRTSLVAMLAGVATIFGGSSATAADYSSGTSSSIASVACGCGAAACDGLACDGLACGSGCCETTGCFDGICDLSCGRGAGFYGEAEALFFDYNRADGTRVGDDPSDGIDFGTHFAPRLTFGFVGRSGLGTRIRWFDYDEQEASDGGSNVLGVDTYTVDIEAFERFSLNRCWDLELSGGVRYNEFDEILRDGSEDRLNSFTGWGGILGVSASRNVGKWGGVYGRLRQAIMVDDKSVQNENGTVESELLQDSILGVTEIATGLEYSRETRRGSLLTLRAGYEWQLWQNYSSSFLGPISTATDSTGAQFDLAGEDIFTGPADVGFNGFTLSAALQF